VSGAPQTGNTYCIIPLPNQSKTIIFTPFFGVQTMKTILLALALIAGLATVAAIVAPHVAYACEAGDPSCP